jgi:hypothetical protein
MVDDHRPISLSSRKFLSSWLNSLDSSNSILLKALNVDAKEMLADLFESVI